MTSVPLSEILVLKDIFEAAGGDSWLWSEDATDGVKWNFSVPDLSSVDPCKEGAQWQRVRCSHASGSSASLKHILEVNLTTFGLIGTLPSTLGNLTALTFLSFTKNALGGRLPHSLGHLTRLETFYADFNSLTGGLPSTIGSMQSLRDLDLDNNELTGHLPTSLGSLSTIQYMDIDNNFLSGTIPPEMKHMRNLGDTPNVPSVLTSYS